MEPEEQRDSLGASSPDLGPHVKAVVLMRIPLGFAAVSIAPGEIGETSTTIAVERYSATKLVAGSPSLAGDATELVEILVDGEATPEWSALSDGLTGPPESRPDSPIEMRKGQQVTVRLKNRGATAAQFFVTMLGTADVVGVPLQHPPRSA